MTLLRRTAILAWATARLTAYAAATALLVVLVAVTALPAWDMRTAIVTSGSMNPEFDTGSAIVLSGVDGPDVRTGDVIMFRGLTSGAIVTHRVVDRAVIGDDLYFKTQGDANDQPDVDLAAAGDVLGRVELDVPHAGRMLAWISWRPVRVGVFVASALWLTGRNLLSLVWAMRVRTPAPEGIAP